MYTLEQIEQVSAAIHNDASGDPASLGRIHAITRIQLKMWADGHSRVEKESLSDPEIKLIDHFLK